MWLIITQTHCEQFKMIQRKLMVAFVFLKKNLETQVNLQKVIKIT